MRIAIETNDGVHLSSQYYTSKNFLILEIPENSFPINLISEKTIINRINQKPLTNSVEQNENILNELSECSTDISHGLNRPQLNNLQRSGVDVLITFKNRIDDAVGQYLKDKMIHEFHGRN